MVILDRKKGLRHYENEDINTKLRETAVLRVFHLINVLKETTAAFSILALVSQ